MTESNPFRAPSARVADHSAGATGQLLAEPRKMAAGASSYWLGTAWEMFKDAPGPWVGMFLTMMGIIMVISIVPILGMAASIIMPIFTAGMMLAAEGQHQGTRPNVGLVFEGFRRNAGNLAMVGVLYLVVTLGFGLLVGVGAVGLIAAGAATGGDGAASAGLMGVGLVLLLGMTAVFMPLSFAISWAPALVALHEVSPLDALKSAFSAAMKNWLALFVFGLFVLLLMVPAVLTLGLGFLVIGPMMFVALWAAYRDIFLQ